MRKINCAATACAAACALGLAARMAHAHGFVGDRFFPPTITTDDPFADDELALPTVSYFRNPAGDGSPASEEIDSGAEFDKEIFPHFALGISDDFIWQKPGGGPTLTGWDNIELSAKYQLWQNEPHEAIVSVGLLADITGAGSKNLADPFSTLIPTVYFGKGFGDLPNQLDFLKPLAVTGTIGEALPTSTPAPDALQWGFAVEYSIPYLQQVVKDVGIPAPFKNVIPLVEFSLNSPENREGGQTTGTIDPGILWENPYFQIGAEALLPVNQASGKHIGAIVQMWIFIDDIFPKIFGHSVFGED